MKSKDHNERKTSKNTHHQGSEGRKIGQHPAHPTRDTQKGAIRVNRVIVVRGLLCCPPLRAGRPPFGSPRLITLSSNAATASYGSFPWRIRAAEHGGPCGGRGTPRAERSEAPMCRPGQGKG